MATRANKKIEGQSDLIGKFHKRYLKGSSVKPSVFGYSLAGAILGVENVSANELQSKTMQNDTPQDVAENVLGSFAGGAVIPLAISIIFLVWKRIARK